MLDADMAMEHGHIANGALCLSSKAAGGLWLRGSSAGHDMMSYDGRKNGYRIGAARRRGQHAVLHTSYTYHYQPSRTSTTP